MLSSIKNIYVAKWRIDMRFGLDRLYSIAKEHGADPMNGDIVVFRGRNPKRIKVLHADQTGLWLSVKRYCSEGSKARIRFLDDPKVEEISRQELVALLQGENS